MARMVRRPDTVAAGFYRALDGIRGRLPDLVQASLVIVRTRSSMNPLLFHQGPRETLLKTPG